MPVGQRCPICHGWFMGSDAIGFPCPQCEMYSDIPDYNDVPASIIDMNFYIWESPGFYGPGYLIYVNSTLSNIIDELSQKRDYNWYFIQGIETEASRDCFKGYLFSNTNEFEKDLEERRQSALNNKNGIECINFHKKASLKELMDMYWYYFLYKDKHQELIDKLLINKRSPWFIEPNVQSCKTPFSTNPIW